MGQVREESSRLLSILMAVRTRAASAVTTVGFGDLAPSTDGSKLFTVVYILGGIGIVTTYLRARLEFRHAKRSQRRS